jgi:hypothetical protein
MKDLCLIGAALCAVAMGCGSDVATEPGSGGGSTVSSGGAGGTGGDASGGGKAPIDEPFEPVTLAASTVRLGTTDWDGVPDPGSAWRTYGHDIDGMDTLNDFTGHCQPAGNVPPEAVLSDGYDGIDNSFGQNLLPIVIGFAPDAEYEVNDSLQSGEASHLFALDGTTTASMTASYHRATSLGSPPMGGDCWPVAPEGLSNPSDPGSALVTLPGAFYATGFEAGPAPSGVVLNLGLSDGGLLLQFPLRLARVSVDSGPSLTGTVRVTLSGVVDAEEYIDIVQAYAGQFSEELCNGSTFESIANQIRAAADIMNDGTQNPSAVCNGISVGLGFEMAVADICGVGPAAPPIDDPCL